MIGVSRQKALESNKTKRWYHAVPDGTSEKAKRKKKKMRNKKRRMRDRAKKKKKK